MNISLFSTFSNRVIGYLYRSDSPSSLIMRTQYFPFEYYLIPHLIILLYAVFRLEADKNLLKLWFSYSCFVLFNFDRSRTEVFTYKLYFSTYLYELY